MRSCRGGRSVLGGWSGWHRRCCVLIGRSSVRSAYGLPYGVLVAAGAGGGAPYGSAVGIAAVGIAGVGAGIAGAGAAAVYGSAVGVGTAAAYGSATGAGVPFGAYCVVAVGGMPGAGA